MPGKKSKKKKEKKRHDRSSTAPAGKPSIFLGTLHTTTTGESVPRGFWGGPECGPASDFAESYRPSTNYQNWYDYDQRKTAGERCIPTSEVNCLKNPAMEVEEALQEDSPAVMVTESTDSESDEPPAPKAPPKAHRSGARKSPHVIGRGGLIII
ncbi:hypothetical protein P4O66_009255 [Electrophorus voltai]|uniref:Uncharacterized protein n=1 Tax=Electrophorus voltai TaxID=2609070 RepID=A0AAD8ZB15_9TELE|nr:hypothetical protein P4O66_009255 [Electrophorus voltai]